jgi:hypothetical protein
MLDVTCHRNLGTTYQKNLEEGGGGQVLEDHCWNSVPLFFQNSDTHLTNSVALVRERTIPTERPPLVGEVSAKFCG